MNALTSIVLTSLAFVTLFVSCNNDDDDNSSSNGGNAITLTADQIVGKWVVTDSNSPYASFEFTEDGNYIVTENAADSLQSSASTKSSLLKPESAKATGRLSAKVDSIIVPTHSGLYRIEGNIIILTGCGTIEVTDFTDEEIHFTLTVYPTGEIYNFVAKKVVEAPTGLYTFYGRIPPPIDCGGETERSHCPYSNCNTSDFFNYVFSDNPYYNGNGYDYDYDYIAYYADSANNCIRSGRTTTPTTLAGSGIAGYADGAGSAAKFNKPYGITVDASGNLYVTDAGNNRIRKITPAGVVSTFAGDGTAGYADGVGTAAKFNYPHGITIDRSGNLYVADSRNNRIRKITPAGVVSTYAGDGTAGDSNGSGSVPVQFNNPKGIRVVLQDDASSVPAGEYLYVLDDSPSTPLNGYRVLPIK